MSTKCVICDNLPASVKFPYQQRQGLYCWRCFISEVNEDIDCEDKNKERLKYTLEHIKRIENKIEDIRRATIECIYKRGTI